VGRTRKTRWPFSHEDKLLRGPGERLRRRIVEIDEQFIWELLAGVTLPMIAGASAVKAGQVMGLENVAKLSIGLGSGLAVIGVSVWRVVQLWRQRANCLLGWFGERIVGEQLQLASVHGWRVFHDVPSPTGNVDHIAVGLGGVFAIETKAKRKLGRKSSGEDHFAYFDGRDLVWHRTKDNRGLDQAEQNALWVMKWIKDEIGERVHTSPILALPGWYLKPIEARGTRLCRVVNPKWLPGILAKERPVLTPKLVDLIALRLDARCRDVED
jgi:hypothetical protein